MAQLPPLLGRLPPPPGPTWPSLSWALLAVEPRDLGIIGPRISPLNRCFLDSAPSMLSSTDERYRQGPDRRQQRTNTVPSMFDERGLVEVVSTEARVNRAWKRPWLLYRHHALRRALRVLIFVKGCPWGPSQSGLMSKASDPVMHGRKEKNGPAVPSSALSRYRKRAEAVLVLAVLVKLVVNAEWRRGRTW
ncbi:hypothetical protein B0T18DRAFT_393645 [Schizothecium vesticola]|uniref:Uncharacterized protein n=1 Tax=Schizothecium vesticola TaxID=314040 RepID=A0AA40EKB1_9PEZI|nr:hypothetical protein B0T18DRAFT_393645 [Schizothecium vesticola]